MSTQQASVSNGQHGLYMVLIFGLLALVTYMVVDRHTAMEIKKANTQMRCIGGSVHNPMGQLLRDKSGVPLSCDKFANVTELRYE